MKACLFITLLLGIFLWGCSSGSFGKQPLIPDNIVTSIETNDAPLVGMSETENPFSATGMLGSYELKIDQTNLTADLTSKRKSAIGESYIVSGNGYFTISPCNNCLKVRSVELTPNELIKLTFYIRHPFKPGDPTLPPTCINRLDLDIFDVALVVLPKDRTPQSYALIGAPTYIGIIANASGYTRELTEVTSNPAAMPYVLVVDDNVKKVNTYNEFPMGGQGLFDVLFKLEKPSSTSFDLYLTMGYGASAKKKQRLNPTYYNPEFNRKAAWKVNVIPPQGNDPPALGNTWDNRDNTLIYNVTVEVFDWQIIANVNPSLTNTYDISASSKVSSVSVEIPGMTNTLPIVANPDSGTGGPTDPLIFRIPIANENLLNPGEYTGLVKVADDRIPGTVISGYEPNTLVHSPNGVTREWHQMPEFATYQTFTATVASGCGPITGSIDNPEHITGIANGEMLQFSANATSANGGNPILLYEWDMNYDGITFTVDKVGQTVKLGPFTNPNCGIPPENPYNYTVAVRATDSCNPSNVTVFDTCQVTVDNCDVPIVNNLIISVNRVLSALDYPVDSNAPFTLNWTPPGGYIPQYAVYVDRNPSDGLTNNPILVGTSTSTTYTTPATEIPSDHYGPGYTYFIRARLIANDPSSEGPASDPAHVIVTGFETLPNSDTLNGEGWLANCEGPLPDRFYRPIVTGSNRAQGQRAVGFSQFVGNMATTGRWNGMVYGPLPLVPNSEVRFMDFSVVWENLHDGGLIVGTCASKPANGWTSPQNDFQWSDANGFESYYGYSGSNLDICTLFNGCVTDQNNCWYEPNNYFTHRKAGGDCNLYGNPNHRYVGIECYRSTYNSTFYSNVFVDEVAIAIY